MSKKYGGKIINWQLHTLSQELDKTNPLHANIEIDKLMLFTGIVEEDPTGRWEPGYHMRSSLIVNFDKEKGRIETLNTIYDVIGEEGDPFLGGDVGDFTLKLLY